VGISKKARGSGRLAAGDAPTLTGEVQGSVQGEGSVFAVMAGVGPRALGEGGFRSPRGYYWGGIVCPLGRCAVSLTLWMPIVPTHASGVDLSEIEGDQAHLRGKAYRLLLPRRRVYHPSWESARPHLGRVRGCCLLLTIG